MQLRIHYKLKTLSPHSCSPSLPGLTTESSLNSHRDPAAATAPSHLSFLLCGPRSLVPGLCLKNSLLPSPRNPTSWTQGTCLPSPRRAESRPGCPLCWTCPEGVGRGGGSGSPRVQLPPSDADTRGKGEAFPRPRTPETLGLDAGHLGTRGAGGRNVSRATGRCPGRGGGRAHTSALRPPDSLVRAGRQWQQAGRGGSVLPGIPSRRISPSPGPILATYWGC